MFDLTKIHWKHVKIFICNAFRLILPFYFILLFLSFLLSKILKFWWSHHDVCILGSRVNCYFWGYASSNFFFHGFQGIGDPALHFFINFDKFYSPISLLSKMGSYVFRLSIVFVLRALTWRRYPEILNLSALWSKFGDL